MHTPTLIFAASALLFQAPQSTQTPDPLAAERTAARERYEKVEAELSRASLESLSPEQRAARASLLDVLDAYVERADFGVQSLAPGARLPQFVDADGRRCAMAELLHATGEDDLVQAVATADNTVWVVELSSDQRFLGWLDQHGLALDEAARIQGPSMPQIPDVPSPGDTVPAPGSPNGPSSPGGGAPGGPGAPSGPRSPGGAIPGGGTPSAGPTSLGPTAPDAPGGSPGAGGPLSEPDSTWWQWWEFNKIEFLQPNAFELAMPRDDAPGRSSTSHLDFMRRAMAPLLARGLEHRDARIRAAAAGAYGRLAGDEAVEALVERLDDSNVAVRDAALLGLGASGSAQAQVALLSVIEDGKAGRVRNLGRRERALAIVALGLGRRIGFDESCDAAVVKLLERSTSAEQHEFGVAAMTYALLNPSAQLLASAAECAADASWPLSVRCRAVEALRASTDASTLGALQHLASGARVELRRSAALALGEFEHPLAVAGLMTAHDLEREPVASSFLLVALGRRGGAKAREHLLAALHGKDAIERPWAALALGMQARNASDPSVANELLAALARERNAEDRGAFWLALGLTRSAKAQPVLSQALTEAADPRSRMYAAQALALLGGEPAREVLVARLATERSALVRSQLALALGVIGDARDLDAIVATLNSVAEPMLQGQVASAIAFHGSSAALAQLGSLLADEKLEASTRAAAMDGLGMVLGRGEALSLSVSSRSANYPQFPIWLRDAYATTF